MEQNLIQFEWQKTRRHFKYFPFIISCVQILALLFFTIVGKLDTESSGSVLQNPLGVISLSNTLSGAVSVVYVLFVANHYFLNRYIGLERERTYIYPLGRKTLFCARYFSLVGYLCLCILLPLFLVNGLFLLISGLTSFSFYIFLYLDMIVLNGLAFLATMLMILVGSFFGILLQSTNRALIVGIMLVAFCSNGVAVSYSFGSFLNSLICILLVLVGILIFKLLLNRIENDNTLI